MNDDAARVLHELGVQVVERGWLSSNNVLIGSSDGFTVIDTGYDTHGEQTLALLRHALCGRPLLGIVNTHLHSDHCGGNAHLQDVMDCTTHVPASSFDDVCCWDEPRLTYVATGQRCRRFRADVAIEPGQVLRWGDFDWLAVEAPGHDPGALMFFQPQSRVLISADALWERSLAVVFPELAGDDGFSAVRRCLDTIERLEPAVVIPGHGSPFGDVRSALAASRARLESFEHDPRRHLGYALRALAMFRLLEHQQAARGDLLSWMVGAPVFAPAWRGVEVDAEALASAAISRLVHDGALCVKGDGLRVCREIGGPKGENPDSHEPGFSR